MIDKNSIRKLTEEKLEEGQFVVEIEVSQSNQISVILDGDKGISIDDCIRISRHIEGNLDRDAEDFELQVSSAGLGQPFRLRRQFFKNLGGEVEVVLTGGQKEKGILKRVGETCFELEVNAMEKVEGKKKKQAVSRILQIPYEGAKTVKNSIIF
ncbi:MAG: ribosome assembly cofactor RimP [Mangrovibacterium sp.]